MKSETKQSAALYVRVSTEEQAKEGYSIQAQTEVLTQYCKLYNIEIFKAYRDLGISGKTIGERPGLAELLDDTDKGCFNFVIVWKISRLSRSLKDLMILVDRFESKGISFISYSEKFDTSTPVGRMTLQILGSIAEFERNTIIENVRLGLRQRAKEGKWTGNHVLGYDNIDKKIIINESEAELVKQIYKMYIEENMGFRKIADTLNKEGYQTKRKGLFGHDYIRRILTNPVYKGLVRHQLRCGNEYYEVRGIHEPIISEEIFSHAQEKVKNRIRIRSNANKVHILAGLLKCRKCGSNMIGSLSKTHGREYRYYKCGKYHRQGTAACTSNLINAEQIEGEIFKRVGEIVRNPMIVNMAVKEIERRAGDDTQINNKALEKINIELGRLVSLKNKYFKLFENDKINPVLFTHRIEEIQIQMERLSSRKIELEDASDDWIPAISREEIEEYLKSFDRIIGYISWEDKKEFLQYLIKSIKLDEEKKIDSIELQFPLHG
ncbi:MAG TPA: recombinase family protein [Pseudobacteroides sp.]|uniref:recombinase family protein n=1 Tax=Pseudobacteroides sp. TaxID=1968840 RepID=UPI002F935980